MRCMAPDIGASIRASETKGGHARQPAIVTEVHGFCLEVDWVAIDIQVWVENQEVAIRRTRAVLQHHDALDQACDAGSRLQVTDVGFGAGLQHRDVTVRAHDPPQSTHFDRVTQCGARAMALGDGDHIGREAALPHRVPDHLLLRWSVRGCHTSASSILVDTASDEDGDAVDRVDLVLANLQLDCSNALATGEAVRRMVKREAPSHTREHAGTAQGDVRERADQRVGTDHETVVEGAIERGHLLPLPHFPHVHLSDATSHQGR
mmetsp:Transcript_129494/g.276182  ORF Transcript_129494/g.276182 Transcript_129494/m.276182 type:complete len:263 (-) Transcript_129494:1724-2512(-)